MQINVPRFVCARERFERFSFTKNLGINQSPHRCVSEFLVILKFSDVALDIAFSCRELMGRQGWIEVRLGCGVHPSIPQDERFCSSASARVRIAAISSPLPAGEGWVRGAT